MKQIAEFGYARVLSGRSHVSYVLKIAWVWITMCQKSLSDSGSFCIPPCWHSVILVRKKHISDDHRFLWSVKGAVNLHIFVLMQNHQSYRTLNVPVQINQQELFSVCVCWWHALMEWNSGRLVGINTVSLCICFKLFQTTADVPESPFPSR